MQNKKKMIQNKFGLGLVKIFRQIFHDISSSGFEICCSIFIRIYELD